MFWDKSVYYVLLVIFFGMCFTKEIHGTEMPCIKFCINKYDYEKYNKLINTQSINYGKIGLDYKENERLLFTESGEWKIKVFHSRSSIEEKYDDFKVIFSLIAGEEDNAAVSINLSFDSWERSDYLLLPAAAYNGNRFDWRRIAYSPKLCDARDIGEKIAPIISDVPRLNIKPGPSFIQERSGAMSLPCIGLYMKNQIVLITTEQANGQGDIGINFEENRSGGCEVTLVSPIVRERYKYEITDNMVASPDIPTHYKKGDQITFRFRIYRDKANNLQDLFALFFGVRNDLSNSSIKPMYPFSECYNTIEKKFNAQNFVPEWGYYAIGMRENFLQDWQIGWTGGMITTYPLLFSSDKSTIRRVISHFDWLYPNGISPSGFFWDSGEKGNRWYGGDIRRPSTADWHLVRKSGDALYYIIKQFELMKKRGIALKKEWLSGTQGVADAFVRLYQRYHQFGQFINSQTGEIVVGGSTSGAIVPAALVLAYRFWDNNQYLQIAQESAQKMYDEYIANGISCGGPGDALQNPDSESWYALLESFMMLYETTRDSKWLQYGIETAHQFSTWVMAYDYHFPKDCLFGRLGMQTCGAVFANTQNKHGSPGICTHSGIALLRLYRATHNEKYLELLTQISQCIPQYMSHQDRNIGDMPAGWINERISTTDWFEGIGEIPKGSTWAETAMLLTSVELPSIYIDIDTEKYFVFDHLTVEPAGKSLLKVSNATAYDAHVKIYSENASDRDKAWKENGMFDINPITLKAGESKIITIKTHL